MVNKSTFGQFLRQKRNEKGMTQKEFAEKLFLSESAISKWEKGKSYPDITMIPDICSVLDISEHELISGANDTEYHEMKRNARVYRKIIETFFWGFHGRVCAGAYYMFHMRPRGESQVYFLPRGFRQSVDGVFVRSDIYALYRKA